MMAKKEPNEQFEKEEKEDVTDLKQKELSKKEKDEKRKAVYRMLLEELKMDIGNIVLGCVCLVGSTASNAGKCFNFHSWKHPRMYGTVPKTLK